MSSSRTLDCDGGEAPVEAPPSKAVADRLFEKRMVMFGSEVSQKTASTLIEQLLALDAADPIAPLTIFLNSQGGEVNSGLAVYDTIRFIRAPVRIVCTGLTASIAAIILLAAKPERRMAMPNARILLHQPLFGGEVVGRASDLEITASEMLKSRTRINTIISEATGRPLEKVEEDTQRDFWLSAEDARTYGLVSKIVSTMSELG